MFSFDVSFKPVGDREQSYGYEFAALGALKQGGYEVESVEFSNGVTAEALADGGESGTLNVPAGVKDFEIDIVIEASDVLKGDEGLALTVSNQESEAMGDAVLDEDICGPTIGKVKTVDGLSLIHI